MPKKSEIERRSFKIEVRDVGDGKRVLAGTPIVYDKKSEDMGFFEYIGINAARDAIKVSDPRLLYGHNSDVLLPIARKKSGTLREIEDKIGVHIEADPPKQNQFVTALIESIERGDVGEMSFGFTVLDDKWEGLDTDKPIRTITKIGEIFDYSYVAFAAYNDTSVALRSLDKLRKNTPEKDIEIINKIDPDTFDKFVRSEEGKKIITDVILGKNEDVLRITIKDETFDFTGDTRFDEAAEKIKSLRSDSKPTLPDDDNTDSRSDDHKDSDGNDDTLDRINEQIKRYSK